MTIHIKEFNDVKKLGLPVPFVKISSVFGGVILEAIGWMMASSGLVIAGTLENSETVFHFHSTFVTRFF